MIPYLARLLDIAVNNATIPSDWKRGIVIHIYKGGDGAVITNTDQSDEPKWFASKWNTS
jgi:hypothetical protein